MEQPVKELPERKALILKTIEQTLKALSQDTLMDSEWKRDGSKRLLEYCTRGKMLRGSLVYTGASLGAAGNRSDPSQAGLLAALGGVMELLQAMLLIHDDIMDQDLLRRGQPSIHAQYAAWADLGRWREARRSGESLGICLGDVAGFAAFELLSRLPCPADLVVRLSRLICRELVWVGYAQMEDVAGGQRPGQSGTREILEVYRFKTGRYTFSLPLVCGAMAAGRLAEDLEVLARVGELLGIIFQVVDDRLNLEGETQATGKPSGSDIRENKQTLLRTYLYQMLDVSEHGFLDSCFGNPDLDGASLGRLRSKALEYGVSQRIQEELGHYAQEVRQLVDQIPGISPLGRSELLGLLEYNLTRQY